jgi:hypothetical protein
MWADNVAFWMNQYSSNLIMWFLICCLCNNVSYHMYIITNWCWHVVFWILWNERIDLLFSWYPYCNTVSTYCNTVSTYCNTVSRYCNVVSTYCNTVSIYCNAVSTYCNTVSTYCNTVSTYCNTVSTYCNTVSTYGNLYSANMKNN